MPPAVPARLRLTSSPAGYVVRLVGLDGAELAEVGCYRTLYRAGLAVRGTLHRAGYCPAHDTPPALIVREVEITTPLCAAILEGE